MLQCGVIECVPNSKSRDEIGKKTDITLHDYFHKTFGDDDTPEFQTVRTLHIELAVITNYYELQMVK